jgi:hypothetical protein
MDSYISVRAARLWAVPNTVYSQPFSSVLTLENFAQTKSYNEAHTLRMARNPNADSLIRNLLKKSC